MKNLIISFFVLVIVIACAEGDDKCRAERKECMKSLEEGDAKGHMKCMRKFLSCKVPVEDKECRKECKTEAVSCFKNSTSEKSGKDRKVCKKTALKCLKQCNAKSEEEVEIEEESDNAFDMIQDEVNEEEEKASCRAERKECMKSLEEGDTKGQMKCMREFLSCKVPVEDKECRKECKKEAVSCFKNSTSDESGKDKKVCKKTALKCLKQCNAKLEEEVEIEEESDIAFDMTQDEVNEEEEKASCRAEKKECTETLEGGDTKGQMKCMRKFLSCKVPVEDKECRKECKKEAISCFKNSMSDESGKDKQICKKTAFKCLKQCNDKDEEKEEEQE